MKKFVFSVISIFGIILLFNGTVFAQGMMSNSMVNTDGHTAREEAEGKAVWEKLQAKQTTCADLSDENFGTVGEYFMGKIMGTSHEAMNNMMIQMMGEQGEEQTHVVMGKRVSGCDSSAAFPSQAVGFMPMMQMMMGGGGNGNMMGNFAFNQMGFAGFFFMLLWWALIIAGIIALARWIFIKTNRNNGLSPMDILKNRYAKGEIDRKEFEEKKKDIA